MQLKYIIEELQNLTNKKVTQKDIAQALGVTKQAINNKKNSNYEFQNFEIKKIKEYFLNKNQKNELTLIDDNLKTLPHDDCVEGYYYPDVFGSCGNGAFVLSDIKEKIQIPKQAFFQNFSNKKTYSVINAVGNSMEPLIYDKDKVIIEHFDGGQIMDNKPYIFCYKDEIFIKRLAKNVNQLMIIPENKMYDIIKLTKEEMNDVYVIGQIVGLIRDLR